MARILPSPRFAERQPEAQSVVWLLLFHGVGVAVGVGMAVLVLVQLRGLGDGLGTGSPLVHEVLALDASIGSRSTTGALGSGSAMLSFVMLTLATGAAGALLGGAFAACWSQRRRTAHRLATIGMWMALIVCLAAMLPGVGYPFGEAQAVLPGHYEWHPAPKALAVASAAGLLLSSITRQRGHRSAAG